MTRIAMHGATGRMGRSILGVIATDPGATVAGAVDHQAAAALGADAGLLSGGEPVGVKVTSDLDAALADCDVLIDFSLPLATRRVLEAVVSAGTPLVMGTTGLTAEHIEALDAASAEVPIVFAPNFSQGVTALFHLAARAAQLLGPAFDAEITEIHHKHKVDSPSGTAMRLAEVVADAKGIDLSSGARYGREGQVGARTDGEMGVLAIRGADVVGEHTLFLFGEGERIEITHRATDRAIFARGAVRAAHWITQQRPGRYDMFDVMGVAR